MMYIGRLNEKFDKIDYVIYKKDTRDIPAFREAGNPFFGEELFVHWSEMLETGADICVSLSDEYYLNEIVLTFTERSKPSRIRLFTADKAEELYSYQAETKQTIKEKIIALPVERKLCEFVIEVDVAFADVILDDISIYGADMTGLRLFPTPAEMTINENCQITIDTIDSFSCDDSIGEAAASILQEKWGELTGKKLCKREEGKVKLIYNADVAINGYQLSISEENVCIEASDLRGMVYGVEVLIKMASAGILEACEVKDAPCMPFRGVHLMIPHPSQFDFAKRLVKYVISPMGYNCIIMELAGAMEFESHPEINRAVEEAWVKGASGEWPLFPHKEAGLGATVKKELLRDFVAYCRSFGVDVIPEIQSLGHVQFMTAAHPDITEKPDVQEEKEEIDGRDADIPPNDFYGHSYCPSNPKSYEILFDLIDEIVEVFTPKEYVHMGHDEVYQIGVCPKCKDKNPADLLADDINRIHGYLAKKGLKMMVWADMFQPVTKYKTSDALNRIPKDILLLDFVWYFHMDEDIEDNLLSKDFKVVLGNMYSSHYPRYEKRVIKENVVGAQTSSWVATTEYDVAKEGKIYEFLYAAQMLWSAKYSSHARYSYDRLISGMMPEIRSKLKDVTYPSMTENKTEYLVTDEGAYCPETSVCQKKFEIGTEADSIIFEHTATEKLTRIPWVDLDEIGNYQVVYGDGSEEWIPVLYSSNISHWNRHHSEPFKEGYYRHNGYQAVSYETDGVEAQSNKYGRITAYRYEWINPNPNKVIEKIQYIPNPEFKTEVYVSRLSIVK